MYDASQVITASATAYSADPAKSIGKFPENAGRDTLLVSAVQVRELVTGQTNHAMLLFLEICKPVLRTTFSVLLDTSSARSMTDIAMCNRFARGRRGQAYCLLLAWVRDADTLPSPHSTLLLLLLLLPFPFLIGLTGQNERAHTVHRVPLDVQQQVLHAAGGGQQGFLLRDQQGTALLLFVELRPQHPV